MRKTPACYNCCFLLSTENWIGKEIYTCPTGYPFISHKQNSPKLIF